jgi:dynein heavy chain
VLTALDREERRLFHDRIRHLDRRIVPGVSKLTWRSDRALLEVGRRTAVPAASLTCGRPHSHAVHP